MLNRTPVLKGILYEKKMVVDIKYTGYYTHMLNIIQLQIYF